MVHLGFSRVCRGCIISNAGSNRTLSGLQGLINSLSSLANFPPIETDPRFRSMISSSRAQISSRSSQKAAALLPDPVTVDIR
jgi:hypothetical protein